MLTCGTSTAIQWKSLLRLFDIHTTQNGRLTAAFENHLVMQSLSNPLTRCRTPTVRSAWRTPEMRSSKHGSADSDHHKGSLLLCGSFGKSALCATIPLQKKVTMRSVMEHEHPDVQEYSRTRWEKPSPMPIEKQLRVLLSVSCSQRVDEDACLSKKNNQHPQPRKRLSRGRRCVYLGEKQDRHRMNAKHEGLLSVQLVGGIGEIH